jgi:hypothetical protein
MIGRWDFEPCCQFSGLNSALVLCRHNHPDVVTAFLEGCTPEEIGEQYPSLHLSDIYLVIGYYLRHRDEVHTYLAERQRQANMIHQEAKQRFNPIGIRDRLLSRRNQAR